MTAPRLTPEQERHLCERFRAEWITVEPDPTGHDYDIVANRTSAGEVDWCRIVGCFANVAPRRNKNPRWEYQEQSVHEAASYGWGPREEI